MKAYHEIISHGAAHTNAYTNLSSTAIKSDLNTAKIAFKENAGITPTIATYPEGKVDKRVEQTLQKLGYKVAFTMNGGTITSNTSRFKLPRHTVTQDMLALDI